MGDLPQLCLQGLSLMHVREAGVGIQMAMSHLAARMEVRALIAAICKPIPSVTAAIAPTAA